MGRVALAHMSFRNLLVTKIPHELFMSCIHIDQLMINSTLLMTSSKYCIDIERQSRGRSWSHLQMKGDNHQEEEK
jgi:hypothetical protein